MNTRRRKNNRAERIKANLSCPVILSIKYVDRDGGGGGGGRGGGGEWWRCFGLGSKLTETRFLRVRLVLDGW